MSASIIRQLEERHVAIKVDLMVWSNKMDLLAFSNTKGEIALHRLSWQRVWLLPPPTPDFVVRKIAWRPDGRVLAVAYVPKVMVVGEEVKGEVMLVDVENKDILHTSSVSDDVSCLHWLQEKHSQEYPPNMTGSSHNQDGTSDFLPKLPSLSRTFGSLPDNIEENLEDAKRIKDQTHLNFLLVGTCDGNLYLSVFGLFSCGVININKFMTEKEKGKFTSILKAEMRADMKSLCLLVAVDEEKFYAETMKEETEGTKKENADPVSKNESQSFKGENTEKAEETIFNDKFGPQIFNRVHLSDDGMCGDESTHGRKTNEPSTIKERELKIVILDTRVLCSRSRELHALSLKHGHVISLLDYLDQTMRSIIEAWENIYLLEIESKLSTHAASLPDGSLSADFLELLLFGVSSDSLDLFLINDLNDKGIKKLGHSIELSHSNIQKLILKHLLSVGQSLAYHLAEMKGMAKLTDRFKVLGLEEEAVAEAFNAAGTFLIKSTEVQLVIDDSMKRYKAFFRWLYAVILRLNDDRIPDLTMSDINQQDLEFIADYLRNLDVRDDEVEVRKEAGLRKRHCYLDRLGQYLVNHDLTIPSDLDKDSLWQKLLEGNPCLQNHFSLIQRCKRTSLVQQHEQLKAAIDNVFKTPEFAIGNMFQLKTIVDIDNLACKSFSMSLLDDLILICLIEADSPEFFRLIKISTEGKTPEVQSKYVSFRTAEKGMKCLEVQFYLPEIISILLEEQDENKNSVIAQAMTRHIYQTVPDILEGEPLKESSIMRLIPDLVASTFAVSGSRKVAIVLSESRRKVRIFEMEADDEEDEEEMAVSEPPAIYFEAEKAYYKAMQLTGEEKYVEDEEVTKEEKYVENEESTKEEKYVEDEELTKEEKYVEDEELTKEEEYVEDEELTTEEKCMEDEETCHMIDESKDTISLTSLDSETPTKKSKTPTLDKEDSEN